MIRKIINALRKKYFGRSAPKNETVVTLYPEVGIKGRVLLSYVIDPFLRKEGEGVSLDHTHYWESHEIARIFLSYGFIVDIISYMNKSFQPGEEYDFFVSARTNFDRISNRLNSKCIKVAHLDTAHWLFNNYAAYQRLIGLKERRGCALNSVKMVEANRAIENADLATVLGNSFTIETYAYANKPIYRIPISTTAVYPWDDSKDYDQVRGNFIWFGSDGFVHKGLDLVLEAFKAMPQFNLVVCGPFDKEKEFVECFHHYLYETSNIKSLGWVDVTSDKFVSLIRDTLGLVYPTCSEGGGGSAITCMHAGIIPVVSYEASVDIGECGIVLRENSISEIKREVASLASRSAEELRDLSRKSWQHARMNHTREIFTKKYQEFVEDHLLARRS